MIEPETIIDGRYRVISRIGSGGMADVYLAQDQLLGREVAVKVLHHHFAEDHEFVERFRREASSAAALSHPNIVGIFDRGEWNGTYYIAMEYVAGRSLKAIVREDGALEPRLAIDIVVQILRAARFAHRRGVIHRDLKPHNVILDEEGRARVTDFGIARAGASDMTLTGSIMGTAQYLSPEQAQGFAVSDSSDLYSVGVILYELLTGVVPFEGDSAVAIAFKQVSATPRRPSELNPSLPPSLDAIVMRALAKDPAHRYAERGRADHGAAARARRAACAAERGCPPELCAHSRCGCVRVPSDGRVRCPAAAGRGRSAGALAPGASLPGLTGWAAAAWRVLAQTHRVVDRARAAARGRSGRSGARAHQLARVGEGPGRRGHARTGSEHGAAACRPAGCAVAALEHEGRSGPGLHAAPCGGRERPEELARGHRDLQRPRDQGARRRRRGDLRARAAKLRGEGFKAVKKLQSSEKVAIGKVIGTEPPAGAAEVQGSMVVVLVSSGPAPVNVPDLKGETLAAAEAELSSDGLTLGAVTKKTTSTGTPGTVLSQSPTAGSQLRAGGKVSLTLAQEPKAKLVAVPTVVGDTEAAAVTALHAAGLEAQVTTVETSEAAQQGKIVRQSPTGGTHAAKGSTAMIFVGVAPSTTTTTTPGTTTPSSPPGTSTP